MKYKLKSITVGAVAAAIALAGAGQARAADIQIAAVHAQTGPLAFLGVPAVKGMKLAVDELNAKHFLGKDNLVLDVQDDGAVTTQTMTLINRAALQLNALVILGPSDSIRSVAVAPLVNDLKVPTITTAQSAAGLAAGPWLFKVTVDPQGAILPLVDFALKKLSVQTVATVYLRDNDGQIANMKFFTDGMEKGGAKIVARESILSSETDYSAVATKIASLNPDAVYLGANAVQAANIVLQLKRAGVRPDIRLFGTSSLGLDYIKAGGAAVDNTFMTIDYNPESATPYNKAFFAAWKKTYGSDPENYSGVGYDCIVLAANAIKAAGPNPTREKVRDALMALKSVPVVMGNGHWTENPSRVPDYGIVVAMIQGGKIVAAP